MGPLRWDDGLDAEGQEEELLFLNQKTGSMLLVPSWLCKFRKKQKSYSSLEKQFSQQLRSGALESAEIQNPQQSLNGLLTLG